MTLLVLLVASSSAFAQTGPALMIKPFDEGQRFELWSEATFFGDGETKSTPVGEVDFDLFMYEGTGRVRLTGEDQRSITLGVAVVLLDIETSLPVISDEQLTDQSIALGIQVGEWSGWRIDAVLGIGYAGNDAYAESNALYGIADVIFTKELDEQSSLQIIIDYNGNRNIWPDLPLPAIAYLHKSSDTFKYTVGLPMSSLTWNPCDRSTVHLQYSVPTNFGVDVDYKVLDTVTLFGAYSRRVYAFAIHDDQDNRRLFFEQSRAEAGVRWNACANFTAEIAGGYAFSQSFEHGFDVRDTDNVVDIEDEPYVRVALNIGF